MSKVDETSFVERCVDKLVWISEYNELTDESRNGIIFRCYVIILIGYYLIEIVSKTCLYKKKWNGVLYSVLIIKSILYYFI